MVGDSLPSPPFFFSIYTSILLSPFLSVPPFFHFLFFSYFLLPHFSMCVVVHVGGLDVICQLFVHVCSPILCV